METSLHRQLKQLYAGPAGRTEIRLGTFRVDAVTHDECGEVLVEIQHGPLWAIRDKVRHLTKRRRVRVVKPIVGRKRLIRCNRPGGQVICERNSPRQGRLLEVFDELVFFTRTFPHRNLSLDIVLVDIEEWRLPAKPSKNSRRRRWRPKFNIEDQRLIQIRETVRIIQAADLKQLVNCALPSPFHTASLATQLGIQRWTAQRIAYVLRKVGAATTVGKQRGAWLYQWNEPVSSRRAA